ncbi:hypothetical protein T265_09075 [Opisthorchis viverrini]|uniref:Uncharacterized protein n=1 Tax=Opisthorchis viverrini TaxID=6198 RepID=A0A074ZI19_OPIVI|nr:hypothetical protein T265_09075 [Opisthorchis viverrini]KER22945.1 hypothetical protein T265_09075 [Opisthorchis viverrini]
MRRILHAQTDAEVTGIKEIVWPRTLYMYSKLETLLSQPKPAPICSNAKSVAIEAYDHLRCHHYLGEAEQLVNLLSIPHIKVTAQVGNRVVCT